MPSRVQHAVYTIGTVNIHHVIQMMIKTVIRLPILALVFYPITVYNVISDFLMLVFLKVRLELKCHRYDVTDVDEF